MITGAARIISRVARLAGLVSKPELNGKLVILVSFNEVSQRYEVRTFADPNNEHLSQTLSVKRSNIELAAPSFDDVYQSSNVVAGLFPDRVAAGSILDISQSPFASTSDNPIIFSEACSIRGAPFTMGGEGRPTTRIVTPIHVQLQNDSDVVEFEDISFNIPIRGGGVSCVKGKNITFRRCSFFSLDTGCGVAGPGTEVFFENCLFEDLTGSGLVVAHGGRATLLNCIVRKTNIGIEVRDGASAHCIQTTFSDTRQPSAAVYAKGLSLTMEMCTVLRSKDSGIIAQDGGAIFIQDCRVEGCAMAGVAVEGPSRSSAHVSGSVFTGCQHGVLVQTGKSDVTIERCKMIQNTRHGLFIGEDAVGTVLVNDCVISENRQRDINNDGGHRSTLVRDGLTLAQDGLMATLSRSNPAAANRIVQNAFRHVETSLGDNMIGHNSVLEIARVRKMAGVGSIFCAACDKEEPPKVKYNKCSQCMNACYCSRDCQVAHWKVHKAECKKRVKNPQLLDPTQSVSNR